MPIYEYICSMCRHQFEARVSIAGRDWGVKCPKCGADVRRLPSAPSFKLVGKGFYENDYKKKEG